MMGEIPWSELAGFPVPLGGDCFSPALVADFDGNGKPEVAVAVDNVAAKGEPGKGMVSVVDASGQALPGWPVTFPQALGTGQMALGNLLAGSKTPQFALGTSDGKLHLLTSRGVDKLVNYWLGENGYGPFLARLRKE